MARFESEPNGICKRMKTDRGTYIVIRISCYTNSGGSFSFNSTSSPVHVSLEISNCVERIVLSSMNVGKARVLADGISLGRAYVKSHNINQAQLAIFNMIESIEASDRKPIRLDHFIFGN